MNVMIVEDDTSIRESLSRVLEDAGYATTLAKDGQEAVERFNPNRVDCLLLDIGLPIRDGWDVLECISQEAPGLPTIVITARDNQRSLARAAGVGALMEKPVDVPELLKTMSVLLSAPRQSPLDDLSARQSAGNRAPAESSVPPLSRDSEGPAASGIITRTESVKRLIKRNRSTGPGGKADDAAVFSVDRSMAARVKRVLASDPGHRFENVQVTFCKGMVQLAGFVNYTDQKAMAGELARKVPWVMDVANDITVRPEI